VSFSGGFWIKTRDAFHFFSGTAEDADNRDGGGGRRGKKATRGCQIKSFRHSGPKEVDSHHTAGRDGRGEVAESRCSQRADGWGREQCTSSERMGRQVRNIFFFKSGVRAAIGRQRRCDGTEGQRTAEDTSPEGRSMTQRDCITQIKASRSTRDSQEINQSHSYRRMEANNHRAS